MPVDVSGGAEVEGSSLGVTVITRGVDRLDIPLLMLFVSAEGVGMIEIVVGLPSDVVGVVSSERVVGVELSVGPLPICD